MPAARAATTQAPAGNEPLSLVVGLKPGADDEAPAERLEDKTDVEVVATEPVAGLDAVTVDVAAADRAKALAALRRDPAVAFVEVDGIAHAFDTTPNDEFFPDQWGLMRTGVPTAWDTTTGSEAVTVAVVDSGVSAVSEIAGRVLPGYDFVNDDDDARDDQGHGTLVATQLAGTANNSAGIAGVCWSCRILPVKVMGRDGMGNYSTIAEGITWAADHGADIINLSLGGSNPNAQVLRNAVAYAVARGVLVIAAAGNFGDAQLTYPAAIPAVVAVGASDRGDGRDSYSSYGAGWVDVAAPGCNTSQKNNGLYYDWCGTSSAAPLVAGIAALTLAARPGVGVTKLRNNLIHSALPLSAGWVANGRVRANVAVRTINDDTPPTVGRIVPAQATRVGATFTTTITGVADATSGISRAELWVNGAYYGHDLAAPYYLRVNTAGRNGTVSLQWRVYDRAGNMTLLNRAVVADNAGPAVRITGGPKNKAKVKGTVTLKTAAFDRAGVSRIEVLINGKVAATDRTAPYTFKLKVSKYAKTMKVRVRAYDMLGNVSYVATRTWTR